jgi:hypothetical protein
MENEARPSPLNAVCSGPSQSVSEREDLTGLRVDGDESIVG